jgi:hypothetical protein
MRGESRREFSTVFERKAAMRKRFMADFIGRQCQCVAMALLVLTVASASTAWAQAGGAIGGSVLDESGAALPGATVTVTNLSNGFTETFVTGERGNYRAVALPPATYEIRVELSGFAIVTRRIVLTVGTDATVDIRMGIASVTENVTVVGETALVEVNRSQPSSVITNEQIESLPTLQRNFQSLAQLLPGAKPAGQSGTGSLTGTVTNFGGIADPRNGFTTQIDGGTVDDAIWGSPVINMGQDAIQEFKVYRNQFDAQYGAALAAVISVVTKSGANQPRGSAFYFGRDKRLNAINPAARQLAQQPPFNQIRVGGSYGGPIVRNKTHYFAAYEHLRINTASITNVAPSNPFKSVLDGVFPTGTRSDDLTARVDHRFNQTHSMYVRYAFDDQSYNGAEKPLTQIDGLMLGGTTTSDTSRSHSIVIEENWIQSSSKVNTLRLHILKHQVATVPTSFTMAVSKTSGSWGQNGIAPQYFPRLVLSFNDTWFLTTPRHNFKVGGDFVVGRYNFEAHFNESGRFSFNTDAPFNANDPATWPFSFTQQEPGDRKYNSNEIAAYVQDDWRVFDRIRLNLGLRYDLTTNLRANDFYYSLMDDPQYAGIENFISRERGNDYSAIQPRIGGTWDVRGDGRLVARAGAGLYVTRNRPWFQMTSIDKVVGNTVIITEPEQLRFYPNINAVLLGRNLGDYVRAGAERAPYLISNDLRLPRQRTITAGFGWQMNAATSLEADWVRSYGWDQLGSSDINLPPTGRVSATNPRPVRGFSQVTELQNFTLSWYDAMEMQVKRRFGGGNSLQGSYTWSRSLLDGVDFYSTRRGTERTPQQFGYSPTDRTHNISVSATQALPFGIQLAVIARYLSGTPVGASAGVDLDGDGSTTGDRPPGLAPRIGRGDVERQLALINEYRASIRLAPVTLADLELNSRKELDVRATKSLQLGNGRRLQVFFEAFNLPNWSDWSNGSGNMRSSSFLVKEPGGTGRQIQWGTRFSF